MKKHIPNFITCLNVTCGTLSIYMILYSNLEWAAFFILLGMFFDFFDGLAARLLKVKSDMGRELDSLADIVTFGVAPAFLGYFLIKDVLFANWANDINTIPWYKDIALFMPFVIPAFSALRLAKFNLDTRQTVSFIGLPTPANALFWVGLVYARLLTPTLYHYLFGNIWVLAVCAVILSVLLISELPMFSLKISGFVWKDNKLRYIYFILLVFIALFFGWAVLIFIIPLYILLCAMAVLVCKSNREEL